MDEEPFDPAAAAEDDGADGLFKSSGGGGGGRDVSRGVVGVAR